MHRSLYSQSAFPVLQNRVYESQESARTCPTGDIVIVEDLSTGLIYNAAFRTELMAYDSYYNNEQGQSQRFRMHLEKVANIIESYMGKEDLVEVGCGKGFFLEMLLKRGVDIRGFDPTYEGSNERITQSYFQPSIINHAKCLILRHVLEHIPNPVDFLFKVKEANGGGGLIYIEVPCFDWICERCAWYDIFYEHVNYFRLCDFNRMFGKVLASGKFFGNQYIYIVADLETLCEPKYDKVNSACLPSDLSDKLVPCWSENTVSKNLECVWGGSSKGVIFSLLCERSGRRVGSVIDINPAKQGKFLPTTGLLVQSPEDALPSIALGSTIYVMNSNYLEEIKFISRNLYKYRTIDYE
jgi:hypothetical protein